MPDRSLRLTPHLARPLLREGRPGSSSQAPEESQGSQGEPGAQGSQGPRGSQGSQDDNPFAPPPEGTPERPWQPRRPANGSGSGDQGGNGGQGDSPWGSQWSDQQPGRSSGGFGDRPRGQGPDGSGNGQNGQNGQGGQGGLRWDPTDPAQRRARYALLSGMWAFFFALFGWRYVALLLGALGLYWAISALRAKPRRPDPSADAPASGARPQTTAAISGLVTAALALAMVLATFGAQLIYRDYYTCRDDALTNESKQSCDDLLPKQLRPLLSDRD
ncbi:hypothetical protein [Streptomyces sp. NPDC059063]|uniref:hypothetical protein n=1 Tax=unclassified Streptomyces TaxID=2593676 RepID=UPI0036A5409F